MDDHFDTSGVFEISKFDISKFACIRYWKSANDIIVVKNSVHSINQNEYMQTYRHSRPSACVVLSR